MSGASVYTLVTGASNGIGKAFAEECAARGHHVLLVALPEPKLEEVTKALKKKYPRQSFDHLGVNLMEPDGAKLTFDWCYNKGYKINILINNAGLGNSGPFESMPFSFYHGQMQLNMISLVGLTHSFLPILKSQEKGFVLNVASIAAFYDVPYKSIYAASKQFVLSFSRSLNKELEHSNVSVSALCPGGVLTNEDVKQRTQELGLVARKSALLPEEVAEYTLSQLLKGKQVIVPGRLTRIVKMFGKLMPYNFQLNLMANQFIKNSR